MTQSAAVWLVVLAAVLLANAPFFNERAFLVGPPLSHGKPVAWRLLELLLLWGLTLLLGAALEAWLGQRAEQGWEYYAATACLFLTLASPGFVWRYLRKHKARGGSDHVG
jgi:hypothetical protein